MCYFEFSLGYDTRLCWDLSIKSLWVWSSLCCTFKSTQPARAQSPGFWYQVCACPPRCSALLCKVTTWCKNWAIPQSEWKQREHLPLAFYTKFWPKNAFHHHHHLGTVLINWSLNIPFILQQSPPSSILSDILFWYYWDKYSPTLWLNWFSSF